VFKSEDIVFIDNSPGTDFAILAGCDHMIMSIGTFGWWISWLGAHQRGGDVLYFANYFNFDNDSIQQEVKLEEHYPLNWIPVGDSKELGTP
jgi:galactoside 2-L-fucosyltransferase 1/2